MLRRILLISLYSAVLHLALTWCAIVTNSERVLNEAHKVRMDAYGEAVVGQPQFSLQSLVVKSMHFPAYLLVCPRVRTSWMDDPAACSIRTLSWQIRALNSLLIGVLLSAVWSVYKIARPAPPGQVIAEGINSIPEVMHAGTEEGIGILRQAARELPRRVATLLALCGTHYLLTRFFLNYSVEGFGEMQSLFMRTALSVMNAIFNAPICATRICLTHFPCDCSRVLNSAFCGSTIFILREILIYVRQR